MIIEGQVGIQQLNDGAEQTVRMTKLAAMVMQQLHARYYETTYRKNGFSLVLPATTGTIAAGNIANAAGAASTQFALWNPVGSSVNLSINKVWVGAISGTLPTASATFGTCVYHGIFLNGIPSIQSTGLAYNNFTGGNPPTARYMASAAGAALTGGGAPTILRPMNLDFSTAATFAAAAGTNNFELVEGDIVIPPGFGWVPLWVAAGTTLLNAYGVVWEETPI